MYLIVICFLIEYDCIDRAATSGSKVCIPWLYVDSIFPTFLHLAQYRFFSHRKTLTSYEKNEMQITNANLGSKIS
jgi:hypothetical protein